MATIAAATWILLVAASLIAGASLVAVLVVPLWAEGPAALVGALSFGLAMYMVIYVGGAYGRIDAMLYSLGFFALGIGAGWSLSSTFLELMVDRPRDPSVASQIADPVTRAAVIVVTCFEPERYGPRPTAGMLKALGDEELVETTVTTLPFMFFAQKARYRAIGSASPARSQMVRISERLQAALGRSPVPKVTWANCSGPERLAVRVAEAANAGHRLIVICELAVGESLHIAAAKREVDAMRLEEAGIEVTYTEPLSDSDPIAAMLARRVSRAAQPDRPNGVVLVGHGQPDQRARLNPLFDEQENAFLNRVRLLAVEEGLEENNIRVAWAEWRHPDVTSTIRHLAALGCQRIVVMPAVYPLDGLATRLDLDVAVRQARLDEGIICLTMSAWQDEEQVIAELARRASAAIEFR